MKIGITLEASLAFGKVKIINNFDQILKVHFEHRIYSKDVEHVLIHIICVKPEFDFFFKIRPPRYTKHRKYVRDNIEIDNFFSYDIKINYNEFANVSDSDSLKMLKNEIVKSLSNFEYLKKNKIDFDFQNFKDDMEILMLD